MSGDWLKSKLTQATQPRQTCHFGVLGAEIESGIDLVKELKLEHEHGRRKSHLVHDCVWAHNNIIKSYGLLCNCRISKVMT